MLPAVKSQGVRTRTADLLITSVLFLLEEQPAPQFLGLRLIYWSATNVEASTICGSVLSNTSGLRASVNRLAIFYTCQLSE
jgi:hypothetical protein